MNTLLQAQSQTDSLKLLGDFWTLKIIDALSAGELRYCGLQRASGNINPVTLTSRLKRLEQAGVVKRMQDAEDKACVRYSLTALGQETLPVIDAIDRFSEKVV